MSWITSEGWYRFWRHKMLDLKKKGRGECIFDRTGPGIKIRTMENMNMNHNYVVWNDRSRVTHYLFICLVPGREFSKDSSHIVFINQTDFIYREHSSQYGIPWYTPPFSLSTTTIRLCHEELSRMDNLRGLLETFYGFEPS